jgi:hypothetical protein
MEVRLSALSAGRALLLSLSLTQDHSVTRRSELIAKSEGIENRNHDLAACGIVPQPATLPRAVWNVCLWLVHVLKNRKREVKRTVRVEGRWETARIIGSQAVPACPFCYQLSICFELGKTTGNRDRVDEGWSGSKGHLYIQFLPRRKHVTPQ